MTKSTQIMTKIALFPALMAATAGIVIPLGTLLLSHFRLCLSL